MGSATAYRYIHEAVDLLTALAPTLDQAMTTVRKKAYVILDGTVLPIDRIAADRPYYSGKKKHHRMDVQVLADPAGRLIWASDALPGATHDLTAARVHGVPAALAADDIKCWADKAYQDTGPAIRVPICGKHLRGWRRRHNRDPHPPTFSRRTCLATDCRSRVTAGAGEPENGPRPTGRTIFTMDTRPRPA